MYDRYLSPIAFTLDNVLTQDECNSLIQEAEEKGTSIYNINHDFN